MKKNFFRFIVFSVLIVILFGTLIARLNTLTIAQGDKYASDADKRMTRTVTQEGMRGRILDRNGIVLAYSETSYNVEFLRNADNRTEYHSALYTEALIKAIGIIEAEGGQIIDTSYIRMDDEGKYYYDWRVTSEEAIKARYRNFCNAMGFIITEENKDNMKKWKSAEAAYLSLRTSWQIPESMGYEDAIKIFSIRQEVLLNNYRAYEPITIAYNVGIDVVAKIEMMRDELPGLQTSESSTRIYPRGETAAHLIGYLGRSVTEEMLDLGYSYDDFIGVSGIEKSMESYLTGSTTEHLGSRVIEVNKYGTEIREVSSTGKTDGNDVMLTIDLNLQQKTEEALAHLIPLIVAKQQNKMNKEMNDYIRDTNGNVDKIHTAEGGAIIVMDPDTCEVLASASYPSFDPNWFIKGLTDEQYEMLFGKEAEKAAPMRNKAISSKLAPGSIFKMVTGIAGVKEGVIGLDERVSDKSPYIIVNDDGTRIERNAPKCWGSYSSHQNQNLRLAITNSCNYYFFEVAKRLGIERLNTWAGKFGLNTPTNIELPGEAEGIIGGQSVLYDNTVEMKNQKTSLPGYIKRAVEEKLKGYLSLRGYDINEEAVEACALELMKLQDGTLDGKGPQIRRILSEMLGIPEGITKETNWVSELVSAITELQWKATFTIRTGIGQGVSLVTPMAVARYVSALANKGTVYDVHLVDRIINPNGSLIKKVEPTVHEKLDIDDSIWDAVFEGMKGVVSPEDSGTAAGSFSRQFITDFIEKGYLSGKTGSAQIGNNPIDIECTSWFVAMSPREDPEIIIVVCVPYGLSGSSSAPAIEEIIKYYYGRKQATVKENLIGIGGFVP